jgi:cell division protein ZapB
MGLGSVRKRMGLQQRTLQFVKFQGRKRHDRGGLCLNPTVVIDPPLHRRHYGVQMDQNNNDSGLETELQRLEIRVGELLSLVQQLSEENRALRNRQDSLSNERSSLLQKNEQVRASVEAMIGRLRLLESGV